MRGGPVVSKWRRTNWQQLIIAQTNFLEYERTRLCPNDRQNGVSGQRSSACHASDAAKGHLDDARQAAGMLSAAAERGLEFPAEVLAVRMA